MKLNIDFDVNALEEAEWVELLAIVFASCDVTRFLPTGMIQITNDSAIDANAQNSMLKIDLSELLDEELGYWIDHERETALRACDDFDALLKKCLKMVDETRSAVLRRTP